MKNVFILTWISLIGFQALAQVPEKKNRALVYKTTATWCYPCGTWGWDLANEINAELGDNIIYLALFNSSDGSYNNVAFYNATAVTLAFNFRYSSWPSFGVNGANLSDVNGNQASAIQQACIDSATAFNNSEVIANAASEVLIDSEGKITVNTKATFFEATEGDYFLATYLIEDDAVNQQRGHNGLVEHKGVLRVAIDSLDWGSQIGAGNIDSGYTVSRSYNYTVIDKEWDLSKLIVYNIIWKKVGTKYEYVNGSKHRPGSTAIHSNFKKQTTLNVYPNPASTILHIDTKGAKAPFLVRIADLSGRDIFSKEIQADHMGPEGTIKLDVKSWNKGLHLLSISNKKFSAKAKILLQ